MPAITDATLPQTTAMTRVRTNGSVVSSVRNHAKLVSMNRVAVSRIMTSSLANTRLPATAGRISGKSSLNIMIVTTKYAHDKRHVRRRYDLNNSKVTAV